MKLKEITAVILIALACSAVHAEEWKIYNEKGERIGRIEQRSYGGAVYNDRGERIGTIRNTPYGDQRVYDNQGTFKGRISKVQQKDHSEAPFSDDTSEEE